MHTQNSTEKSAADRPANEIRPGIEDKFYYVIADGCINCGACAKACPAGAITAEGAKRHIDPAVCIDCGTCSAVCPTGAAHSLPVIRKSMDIAKIDPTKLYFNPGCALSLYMPELPDPMLRLLGGKFPEIRMHNICCRHDPKLEAGAVIVNNCAGCDRRFRSLYPGINTISYWEVLDSIENLALPDHSGLTVSIHDSCGYRHKPQVHRAIRNLLKKMNIEILESPFSGTSSVCCGDNFYGLVPNAQVEQRIQMRAKQMPCEDVVVYCIGCVRAMTAGGKKVHYLPELLFQKDTAPMEDSLDTYHFRLLTYIENH